MDPWSSDALDALERRVRDLEKRFQPMGKKEICSTRVVCSTHRCERCGEMVQTETRHLDQPPPALLHDIAAESEAGRPAPEKCGCACHLSHVVRKDLIPDDCFQCHCKPSNAMQKCGQQLGHTERCRAGKQLNPHRCWCHEDKPSDAVEEKIEELSDLITNHSQTWTTKYRLEWSLATLHSLVELARK